MRGLGLNGGEAGKRQRYEMAFQTSMVLDRRLGKRQRYDVIVQVSMVLSRRLGLVAERREASPKLMLAVDWLGKITFYLIGNSQYGSKPFT